MKTEIIKCGEIYRCGPEKFIFSCIHCGEQFNSNSLVLSHIEAHFRLDNEEECFNPLQLPIDDETDAPSSLNANMNECEIDIKPEILPDITLLELKLEPYYPVSPNIFNFQPDYLTISSPSSKELQPKQNQIKQPSQLLWGPIINGKSIVECNICGRQMQKMNTHRHFKLHAEKLEKNGIATNKISLRGKWRDRDYWGPIITQATIVECDLCGRKMKPTSLHRHFKYHTRKLKQYTCDHCGHQFHDQQNLVVHIRKHTGEKPYKCMICEKAFAAATALKIHIRYHTGERPYKCELCSETFFTNTCWNNHMRKHKNIKRYKCSYCEKKFSTSSTRTEHQRSQHTGERPYDCEVCGQTFSRRNSFRQHIVLHTGVKPYQCRVCDAKFAQGAGRRSHERSVHKDVAHLIIDPIKTYLPDGVLLTRRPAAVKKKKS